MTPNEDAGQKAARGSLWTTRNVAILASTIAVVALGAGVWLGAALPARQPTPPPQSGGSTGAISSTNGSSSAAAPSVGRAVVASKRSPDVAKAGSTLTTVTSAPEMTVSELKVPDGFKTTTASLKFEPYGTAPKGTAGERIVVRVLSWDAGKTEGVKDLTGANVLMYVASEESAPDKGGRYEGTVEMRVLDSGRAGLFLQSAHSTE
ncbi:MAG: hypothetical protein HGB10_08350 [Coriobacteriia bacterium]|nr:hypothetical protein [Coriobacteriia bacterium]